MNDKREIVTRLRLLCGDYTVKECLKIADAIIAATPDDEPTTPDDEPSRTFFMPTDTPAPLDDEVEMAVEFLCGNALGNHENMSPRWQAVGKAQATLRAALAKRTVAVGTFEWMLTEAKKHPDRRYSHSNLTGFVYVENDEIFWGHKHLHNYFTAQCDDMMATDWLDEREGE